MTTDAISLETGDDLELENGSAFVIESAFNTPVSSSDVSGATVDAESVTTNTAEGFRLENGADLLLEVGDALELESAGLSNLTLENANGLLLESGDNLNLESDVTSGVKISGADTGAGDDEVATIGLFDTEGPILYDEAGNELLDESGNPLTSYSSGVDAGEQIALTTAETETTAEGEQVAIGITSADVEGPTVDAGEQIAQSITDTDSAVGVDAESVNVAQISISDSDTATGSDGGEVVLTGSSNQFTFTPPIHAVVPPIAYDVPPLGNRLMRFYANRERGRAIWVLPDGTYTFHQPYPTVEDTPQNRANLFPAVPTPPSGIGTTTTNFAITYERVFLGGHIYTVDANEATRLSNFLTGEGYNPNDWLVAA